MSFREIESLEELFEFIPKVHNVATLTPCIRYYGKIVQRGQYEIFDKIMDVTLANDYPIMYSMSLLRYTFNFRHNIRNWKKFKIMMKWIVYNSYMSDNINSMFMGLDYDYK